MDIGYLLMDNEIDFAPVEEFRVDCNFYRLFWPAYYLYRIYRLVCELVKEGISPDDCRKLHMRYSDVMAEQPLYRMIMAVMQNNNEQAENMFASSGLDVNYPLSRTALPMRLTSGWQSMGRMNFLSMAALLGRMRIYKYLVNHSADTSVMIIPSGINPAPYPLSVNECLLMNFIYRWYKRGKSTKMKSDETTELIDAITIVSMRSPAIVSDARLLEAPVRISYYWEMLREIVEDKDLLKRLLPLNPGGLREILNI